MIECQGDCQATRPYPHGATRTDTAGAPTNLQVNGLLRTAPRQSDWAAGHYGSEGWGFVVKAGRQATPGGGLALTATVAGACCRLPRTTRCLVRVRLLVSFVVGVARCLPRGASLSSVRGSVSTRRRDDGLGLAVRPVGL